MYSLPLPGKNFSTHTMPSSMEMFMSCSPTGAFVEGVKRGSGNFWHSFRFAFFFIAFPAAAGDVAAHHALYGQHFQLLGLHASAFKLRGLEKFRHVFCIDGDHMVRHDVFGEIKPELGHLVQNGAFFRHRVFQNHIKCGNTVSADHDQAVAQIVQLPDLAGFKRFVFFHVISSFPNATACIE